MIKGDLRLGILNLSGLSVRERCGCVLKESFLPTEEYFAVKTPKLYFLDTGLAAYLSKWNTPDVMRKGAMAGAFFETFVISEILKGYYNKGVLDPPVYFYRDKEKKEIDLIIEEGNMLYPIEIKKHSDPAAKDIARFHKDGMFQERIGQHTCLFLANIRVYFWPTIRFFLQFA